MGKEGRVTLEPVTRREFLAQTAAGVVLGVAAVGALNSKPAAAAGTTAVPGDGPGNRATAIKGWPANNDWENKIRRQEEDLKRALAKPIEQRQWGMVIDLRRCVGCKACTVACKAENHLPPGVVYRPVMEEERGVYPQVQRQFLPRPCMHCAKPACTAVCPVKATYKRADGIVAIDYNRCIGCRYCIAACPYGARSFDAGRFYTQETPRLEPYETEPAPEYGRQWPRQKGRSPIGNARKCTFCLHRLRAGQLPVCVTTCLGGATCFGDLNDPQSLVREWLAGEGRMRLKEELGTEPQVYYLT
ncbi:4Fe-4S ferredoxin [Moorella sp. Hama-1]|nr:4Fe-4S ferredoxin [Moorella sp. Hama-1]